MFVGTTPRLRTGPMRTAPRDRSAVRERFPIDASLPGRHSSCSGCRQSIVPFLEGPIFTDPKVQPSAPRPSASVAHDPRCCSSGHVFTGHAQHLIVELRAEEERRFEQLVEFGTVPSSTASAIASHSPSPSRPRVVSADGDPVSARTSNQFARTRIEGAISRATAGGISADRSEQVRDRLRSCVFS